MPAALSLRSMPRLKSGPSMPMNTSGRVASARVTAALRSLSSRGKWRRTSARPMTDNSV